MSKVKKIGMILVILLVGAAIGGSAIYLFGPTKSVGESVTLTDSSDVRKLDETTPEGSISPQEVATNPQKYLDKQIEISGLLTDLGDGKYILVSQKTNESVALNLDFSKTDIDPASYANPASTPENQQIPSDSKLKDPITVTGKLSEIKDSNNFSTFTFVVESIK